MKIKPLCVSHLALRRERQPNGAKMDDRQARENTHKHFGTGAAAFVIRMDCVLVTIDIKRQVAMIITLIHL